LPETKGSKTNTG